MRREKTEHRGVASKLAICPIEPDHQPDEGIKPMEGSRHNGQPVAPEIKPTQMDELMEQDASEFSRTVIGSWQKQTGLPQSAHGGTGEVRGEEDSGGAAQTGFRGVQADSAEQGRIPAFLEASPPAGKAGIGNDFTHSEEDGPASPKGRHQGHPGKRGGWNCRGRGFRERCDDLFGRVVCLQNKRVGGIQSPSRERQVAVGCRDG